MVLVREGVCFRAARIYETNVTLKRKVFCLDIWETYQDVHAEGACSLTTVGYTFVMKVFECLEELIHNILCFSFA